MTTVALTGASGFVGAAVRRQLQARGHRCVALGRRPMDGADESRGFELGGVLAPDLLRGCDALVHCAWDLTATSRTQVFERNVAGSIALFEAAVRAGVRRLVFISSMSAYEGTTQTYGRAKLACERAAADYGGVSLRLGLVFSADAGGMVGALRKAIDRPVVPVIGLSSHQFVVALDDAVTAAAVAVEDPTLTGTLGVAHPAPIAMRTILETLAQDRSAAPRLVPVPWRPVYAAMRVAELAGARLPFRSDSVLGLVRPAPEVPRVDEWAARGLHLRRFVP